MFRCLIENELANLFQKAIAQDLSKCNCMYFLRANILMFPFLVSCEV
nr:hypothetical protein UFVOUMOW_UFVOUMOW_CDS_0006 [Microvirus sp.]